LSMRRLRRARSSSPKSPGVWRFVPGRPIAGDRDWARPTAGLSKAVIAVMDDRGEVAPYWNGLWRSDAARVHMAASTARNWRRWWSRPRADVIPIRVSCAGVDCHSFVRAG
jgi:hypothetical protein